MTIVVGSNEQLIATVSPGDATNKALSWTPSDATIASVSSDGTVTGVAAGVATIAVTAADTTNGTKTATCTVTVGGTAVAVTGVLLAPRP